jgi:hypothetical protein
MSADAGMGVGSEDGMSRAVREPAAYPGSGDSGRQGGFERVVGRFEVAKDTAQVLTESAAVHVGRIATILTGAIREIAHEVGDWASDAFEMRDAAERAAADGQPHPDA